MSLVEPKNQRYCYREPILMAGRIWQDEQWVEASILDISPYGARVCLTADLPDVDRLRVQVDGIGEVSTVVTWRDKNVMGVKFEDDPRMVEQRLKEHLARINRIHELYDTGDDTGD